MDDIVSRPPVGLVRELRARMPLRALSATEAYELAERQATQALKLLRIISPGIDLQWLLALPKVEVQLEPRYRMSGLAGMTTWSHGRYLIVINKSDPHGRRRFTLAHEFKHLLDYTLVDTVYARLGRGDQQRRERLIEQLADHFAACLLMPRPWVKKAWAEGLQDPEALAGLFKVTTAAMTVRLQYLGFLDDDLPTATYFRRVSLPPVAAYGGTR